MLIEKSARERSLSCVVFVRGSAWDGDSDFTDRTPATLTWDPVTWRCPARQVYCNCRIESIALSGLDRLPPSPSFTHRLPTAAVLGPHQSAPRCLQTGTANQSVCHICHMEGCDRASPHTHRPLMEPAFRSSVSRDSAVLTFHLLPRR